MCETETVTLVRYRRKKLGLVLQDVAGAIGYSHPRSAQRIETGEQMASPEKARLLARFLDLDYEVCQFPTEHMVCAETGEPVTIETNN